MESGPVKAGDLFQGYRILKLLGQGGYASVYHARREFIDRDVAIKISHRAVTREVFKRFQGEARLTHRLDHPNIVKVEDAAVATSGHLYIVMELLRGQTLWDARKQYGKLTLPEALHLCAQTAEGVEQAHRVGAIHRDLKPLNLFIIAGNRAKVLDFGIAKIADDSDRSSTQRDVVHGTLKYMSPEQLLAESLTPRSDIYALAVIFFELITGRHPHIPENAELTEAQLGLAIVSRAAASLAAIDSSIPSYVVEVIAKALSRDPTKRFASMAEFAEALRGCCERYVREFPHLAELRELWIPAPSVSAVVRSAEPPSQEHIATAVVAVVPPQSLRPTVRLGPAPKLPEPQAHRDEPLSVDGGTPRVQIAATPAPVVGGIAVAARATPMRESRAEQRRVLTVRRIVPVGAAIGFVIGIGATLARLGNPSATHTAPSADDAPLSAKVPGMPTQVLQPNLAPSADLVGEGRQPTMELPTPPSSPSAPLPNASIAKTAPRQSTTRAKSTPGIKKKAQDRLDWFHEDSRSTNEPAAKSGL
ncbi:MAG: serine/threonine protein kinase [Myxococcota bacterium]